MTRQLHRVDVAVFDQTALGRAELSDAAEETLGQTRERLEAWLELGGRGDQRCPCQSGKRYENCCSRRLRDSL